MAEQHNNAENARFKRVHPVQVLITAEDHQTLNDLASELQSAHRGHKSGSRAVRHIIAVYKRLPADMRHAALLAHEDV